MNSVTIVSTNMLVLTIVTMFKMQMQITLTTDADKDADADSLYERVQQFNCTFLSDPGVPGPIYGSSSLKLSE